MALDSTRVTIEQARIASDAGEMILWRPDGDTNPETEYALIVQIGD